MQFAVCFCTRVAMDVWRQSRGANALFDDGGDSNRRPKDERL